MWCVAKLGQARCTRASERRVSRSSQRIARANFRKCSTRFRPAVSRTADEKRESRSSARGVYPEERKRRRARTRREISASAR